MGFRWTSGFVALVVQPDELAVVHAALVGVAHVVVGSGMREVQLLTVEVIFYFYGFLIFLVISLFPQTTLFNTILSC